MKGINKLTKVIMKILEIAHWVATALMAAAAVCSVVAPQWVDRFVGFDMSQEGADLSVYGFEIIAAVSGGKVDTSVFVIFSIGAIIILALMAMIFRSLYLIFTKSEESTPFQEDNVRMLKKIGIFSIAVPMIGFVMGTIACLVAGFESVEVSNGTYGFVMGIIVLCLTQYFAHGVELEKNVDGLL